MPEEEKPERMLLMLLSRKLIPDSAVSLDDFDTALYRSVAERLLSGESSAAIIDRIDGDDRVRVASALGAEFVPDEKSALPMAEDCILQIQMHRTEKMRAELNAQIESADGEARRSLIAQVQQLTQQLNRLKTGRKGWSI